jgi:hypothetical protein
MRNTREQKTVEETEIDGGHRERTHVFIYPHQAHLVAIICPRPELEVAGLLVEGEVAHVDEARALVDGAGDPGERAVAVHGDQLVVLLSLVLLVSTGGGEGGSGWKMRECVTVTDASRGRLETGSTNFRGPFHYIAI